MCDAEPMTLGGFWVAGAAAAGLEPLCCAGAGVRACGDADEVSSTSRAAALPTSWRDRWRNVLVDHRASHSIFPISAARTTAAPTSALYSRCCR